MSPYLLQHPSPLLPPAMSLPLLLLLLPLPSCPLGLGTPRLVTERVYTLSSYQHQLVTSR